MSLNKLKLNNDTFCIAPWTEIHFGVQKEVLPCCIYHQGSSFGSLNKTEDIKEIYNSESAKTLRKNLFNGIKAKGCENCWTAEKNENTESYRNWHNKVYGKYIDDVIKNTNNDFSLKKIESRRLDIRFDNKCNLKCRICSSTFSTSWYADEIKLGLKSEEKSNVYKKTISNKVLDFIFEQLPNVDELFFAGGEPIIQDGHYEILKKAIELGLNKKITLTYNTNFSTLKYKNKSIIPLWKKFIQVNIGASLDGSLEQGEYQRKNIKWNDVKNNILKIKNIKTIDFRLIPTLSIFNVYNFPKFHKEWYENGWLDIDSIKITILHGPPMYNIKNLPLHHKEDIISVIKKHIKWLQKNNASLNTITEYEKIIHHLKYSESDFDDLHDFVTHTEKLDNIRNENFYKVYPEYKDLYWYVKYQKVKNLEQEYKDTIQGYHDSIIEHRKFEHETTEKMEISLKELERLQKGAKDSDEYINNLETWLKSVKDENKKLKEKVKEKEIQIRMKNKNSII